MNELANPQVCILTYTDIEIWIDEAESQSIRQAASAPDAKFIEVRGQFIAISAIAGIHTPTFMEEKTRRKNGQWKCKQNQWHEKNKPCDCAETARLKPFGTRSDGTFGEL